MRGIPLLAAAYGLAAGATLLLTVTVGRALGAAGLGAFALAVAIARIFYAGTDLGLATHLTREVVRDADSAAARTAAFLLFRTWLIPCAVAVVVVIGRALGHDEHAGFALVAVALGLVTLQGLYEALLLAHARPRAVAMLTAFNSCCVALGCGVALVAELDLTSFALGYALAVGLGLVGWGAWAGTRLGVWPHRPTGRASVRREIARSWRIGVSTLLAIAALRAPIVVLGLFVPATDLGAFAAVDTLVTAPGILQVAVTNASFPRLAAAYRTDARAYRAAFWRSNSLLAVAGVVLAAGLATVGDDVLAWLFPSKDFTKIATLMPIAAWSLPGLLLVHHNISIFAASDNEATNLRLMVGWLLVSVVAQLALVPSAGVVGAAWGVVLARTIGLALLAAAVVATRAHGGLDAT